MTDIDKLQERIDRIEEKLDYLLTSILPPACTQTWVDTATAVERLGLSRQTLYQLRQAGRLGKSGQGWRQVNRHKQAKRATYQWHPASCELYLAKALAYK